MRAIETRYKGRLFRSRLEARYAVLFDALRIEWDYEPEGFEFADGTRYLPDFWLRNKIPVGGPGRWIEIKASMPTEVEAAKLMRLHRESGHNCAFFCGAPDKAQVFSASEKTGRFHPDVCGLGGVLLFAAGAESPVQIPVAIERALSARFEFGGRA